MKDLYGIFLSWNFGLLACSVSIIMYVIKLNISYFINKLNSIQFYQKIVLPLLPLILGAIIAIIPGFPFPPEIITISSKILLGIVAGSLSGLIYKLFVRGIYGFLSVQPENSDKIEEEKIK